MTDRIGNPTREPSEARHSARRVAPQFGRTLSRAEARQWTLIASAAAHAARAGEESVCIASRSDLAVDFAERIARDIAKGGVVARWDTEALSALRAHMPEAPFGLYRASRQWMLPPGALHVYFLGSWRDLSVSMLREAVRCNLVSLFVRGGGAWVRVPLGLLRRAVERKNQLLRWWRRSPVRQPQSNGEDQTSDCTTGQPRVGLTAGIDMPLLRRLLDAAPSHACLSPVAGRVVEVCGNLSPGGAERQVAFTARGLVGHPAIESCMVLCDFLNPGHPARYDFYLPLLKSANVAARMIERRFLDREAVATVASLRDVAQALPDGLLLDVANLIAEFRRLRPAVVHAWLDWSNTRAGLAAALAGVPRILLSGRNLSPAHFALYQPYMDPIYKLLAERPNVVLLNNSEAGARDYETWLGLPAGRIRVIRNGFDTSVPRPVEAEAAALRRRYDIPADRLVVGGVFRLSEEKRPLLWIETAARIARALPDVWFVLFGEGAMREAVEARAQKLGIRDRLVMPGVSADVFTAMRAMDVFLLTSFAEGLPNVLIEAQWVGTPVIATAVGGAPEAVDHGRSGWLVESDSTEILAEQVLSALRDPEWRQAARVHGARFVEERFGMERMLRETSEFYFSPADTPGDCAH